MTRKLAVRGVLVPGTSPPHVGKAILAYNQGVREETDVEYSGHACE